MLRFEETIRGPHGVSRRDVLRVGGLSAAGLTLAGLLRGQAQAAPDAALDRTFGRAKNLLFLFLSGGPSQYETFDPKPDAPAEIRGVFRPIATSVPGVRFCELLPRTARLAHKLCVVRSMYTGDPNHESSGYWVNTGQVYRGPNMRAVHPTDWPTFGSVVKMLKPSQTVPFTSVVLPEPIIANPGVFLPGQNGGFLGSRWDPEFFRCDPSAPRFEIEGFTLPPELPPVRLADRRGLVQQLDHRTRWADRNDGIGQQDRSVREALSIVLSSKARGAFLQIKVFTSDFRPMKNMFSAKAERGLYKLVVDAASDKVLGVHMIGPEAPEILQAAAIAVKAGLTKADFDDTMALHPSMAEELVLMR